MVTAVIQIKKSTFVYYVNIVVAKKETFWTTTINSKKNSSEMK